MRLLATIVLCLGPMAIFLTKYRPVPSRVIYNIYSYLLGLCSSYTVLLFAGSSMSSIIPSVSTHITTSAIFPVITVMTLYIIYLDNIDIFTSLSVNVLCHTLFSFTHSIPTLVFFTCQPALRVKFICGRTFFFFTHSEVDAFRIALERPVSARSQKPRPCVVMSGQWPHTNSCGFQQPCRLYQPPLVKQSFQ